MKYIAFSTNRWYDNPVTVAPIITIDVNSQQFPEAVHHVVFVRHEAVDVTVQRDRWVLVSQQLRQGFDIHSALQRTGGKGMPQGMEATVRQVLLFQQERKARLIGAHGNYLLSADHVSGRIFLFHLAQNRHQLLRERDDPIGMLGFRRFDPAVIMTVRLLTKPISSARRALYFCKNREEG